MMRLVGGNWICQSKSPFGLPRLIWNVDASVNPSHSMSAIGGVLRNESGIFMCAFSSPVPPIEINSAGIIAIFRAIQISFENIQKTPITIESDSANAVKWCNSNEWGSWNLNIQLNYIRNARKEWLDISIIHKRMDSNVVADTLSKQGFAEFLAWL